ncbi:MAG: AsmA-like C-terminal region-containing protein [Pseudomonadota bacterium]
MSQAHSTAAAATAPSHRGAGRRWLRVLLWTLVVLLSLFLLGEVLGWRFLRGPLEQQASKALGVPVQLQAPFRLRVLGPELKVARLVIGAPEGSGTSELLNVTQVVVAGRWLDAWRFRRDGVIRLKQLEADELDGRFLHAANAPASWAFPGLSAQEPAAEEKRPFVWPQIDRLLVRKARVQVREDEKQMTLEATATLCESQPEVCAAQKLAPGFQAEGRGTYQKQPVQIRMGSPAPLALMDAQAQVQSPLTVRIDAGGATGQFDGTVSDLLGTQHLQGTVSVKGESMAKLGEPFGLTLPSTGPFRLQGGLARDETRWTFNVKTAQLGESELHGDFVFDTGPAVPRLTGTLLSKGFLLSDFGPTVGGIPPGQPDPTPNTVLPDKPFDVPSLRRMNADVTLNFDRLILGSGVLEALRPLKARVVLADGVLTVGDIVAQTAGGRLTGETSLDARADIPQWRADLQVKGVDLAGWVKGARQDDAKVNAGSSRQRLRNERREALKEGAPVRSYLTGEMQAAMKLRGAGRSTAEILGSASGHLRAHVREGTVSHLAMELAGFDLAQSLGVLVKGDANLPLNCAAFDFVVDKGVAILQRGALDTRDSLVIVSGHTDLRKESMEFTANVRPKDATPFSLRSPVQIVGTYAQPDVKLDKGSIAARVAAGVALAVVAPVAAIAPFIDMGETDESPCFQPVAAASAAGKTQGK